MDERKKITTENICSWHKNQILTIVKIDMFCVDICKINTPHEFSSTGKIYTEAYNNKLITRMII